MTKEELKKEAENWLRKYLLCCNCEKKCNCIDSNSYCEEQVLQAYVDSAEPREKRIADLEATNKKISNESHKLVDSLEKKQKENAELDCQKNRNKFCYSCANATERCFKNEIGCPCDKYKSWKDENAELREIAENQQSSNMSRYFENKKLKEGFAVGSMWNKHLNSQNKALEEEMNRYRNMTFDQREQLTKAKDHIKKLLGCLQQDTNDPQTNYYVVKYMAEAEQFLNSEVEK